jgi:endonuclease-3
MPRESMLARKERTARILTGLAHAYPDAHCELVFKNPLQLLVATILSAQCTDKQVNIVTASLFKKYRTASHYAQASQEELESDIRRIGLFRSKARNIRKCCQKLIDHHSGKVPKTMEELIHLDGVGRKTANVVLGNAYGRDEGIVVDTHVKRLALRLRLSQATTPEKVEIDLIKLVPRNHWTMLSHWFIWHGRQQCGARNPQCETCQIKEHCPSAKLL